MLAAVRAWWWWLTNKVLLLGLSGLLVGVAPVHAAFEYVGGGARARALGQAFAAGRGVEAVWYNPAGNARMKRIEVGTTHARLYPELEEGLSLSALEGGVPLGRGSLQAGFSYFGFGEWQEKVAVLGYGWAVNQRLALGASLRSSGWQAGRFARRSWNWNLGGAYEVGWARPHSYVRVALVLANLTAANISAAGHQAGKTPRGIVFGASVGNGLNELLIDIERQGGRIRARVGYATRTLSLQGVELRFGGIVQAAKWEGRELDAGLGYGWKEWQFDYAYTYPLKLSGLGGTHWISLGFQRP